MRPSTGFRSKPNSPRHFSALAGQKPPHRYRRTGHGFPWYSTGSAEKSNTRVFRANPCTSPSVSERVAAILFLTSSSD